MSLDSAYIASDNLQSIKESLIEKIGPWAFQSYLKSQWKSLSDEAIIEGALASAPEDAKLSLKEIYPLARIKDVWESKVLIQDHYNHALNVWIARNLFKESDPEDFVKRRFKAYKKREEQADENFYARFVASR